MVVKIMIYTTTTDNMGGYPHSLRAQFDSYMRLANVGLGNADLGFAWSEAIDAFVSASAIAEDMDQGPERQRIQAILEGTLKIAPEAFQAEVRRRVPPSMKYRQTIGMGPQSH